MLHILSTIYFSGMLFVVIAGMAVTLIGEWSEISRILHGRSSGAAGMLPPVRMTARRRRAMPRPAVLREAA